MHRNQIAVLASLEDNSFDAAMPPWGIHGAVIDSNRNRMYVVDRVNSRIDVFDLSGKFLDQWPNIVGAYGIRLPADGRYAWVNDGYTQKVMKYDALTGTIGILERFWGQQNARSQPLVSPSPHDRISGVGQLEDLLPIRHVGRRPGADNLDRQRVAVHLHDDEMMRVVVVARARLDEMLLAHLLCGAGGQVLRQVRLAAVRVDRGASASAHDFVEAMASLRIPLIA